VTEKNAARLFPIEKQISGKDFRSFNYRDWKREKKNFSRSGNSISGKFSSPNRNRLAR
jgi:hypothetical protein